MNGKLVSGLIIVFLCIGYLSVAIPVRAVTVNIATYPQSISQDPFILTASVSGATNGTNYLRVDIYKDGTQNYFGETYNGSDWYSSSTYSQYLPITIQANSWNGQVQARLGSPSSSQYDGQGTYKIRLRRYTSGGGYTASEADASAVAVQIILPTPTPTPTTAPVPTDTPYPTPAPTATPFPTIKTTSSPTKIPTAIVSVSIAPTDLTVSSQSGEILGSSISAEPSLVAAADSEKREVNWISLFFVSFGIITISCGILYFYLWKKGKMNGQDTSNE